MKHSSPNSSFDPNLPVPLRYGSSELVFPFTQTLDRGPSDPTQRGVEDGPAQNSILEYWQILRRQKRNLLLFVLAGAVLGFVLTLPQTRIYQARTSVEVIGLNDNFLNMRDANPVSENATDYETSDIQTQAKILQSDGLKRRTLDKLGLFKDNGPMESPSLLGRITEVLTALLRQPQPRPITAHDRLLLSAAESLRIRAVGQTRIIEVTIDSKDPQLAATFANKLISEFIEQSLDARLRTTETTANWLSRQIEEIRSRLERSENTLQAYSRKSGLIVANDKTNVSGDKLMQLQDALSKATTDRIAKQSRYEIAQSAPPGTLLDVLNDDSLRETFGQVIDLKRQVADLVSVYTDDYGKLKRVQAQLNAVQAAFDAKRNEIVTRIKNDYDEALHKEKLLTAAYNSQVIVVTADGEKAIQYNILKRDADSNRQLYDNMLQQLKQSSIASAMKASNLRIVDVAVAPGQPYKPQVSEYAALGAIAGTFFGAAFVVMSARSNRTIQKPGESMLYLNLPELGVIPATKGINKDKKPSRQIPGRLETDTAGTMGNRIELAAWQDKPSFIAESFRSTLVSIFFANHGGPQPNTFVLTSAGPGEGKSTIASNLAIAVAEVGQRVLLIDADLRRPRLHEIFQIDNTRGLSDVLRERVSLNGDISLGSAIRETAVPGLFLLPSGQPMSAATNLLYGPRTSELFEYLKGHYDTIFIDSPPMLSMPDARVLGRAADRVIFVLRAGSTTRDAALAARQRFAEDGTKIIGTILNNWEPKNAPNGYYGYYANRYHYDYKPQQ